MGSAQAKSARALELGPLTWLESKIGRPKVKWSPGRGQAWQAAAERIDAYRGGFKIEDQEQPLGLDPPKDLAARAARGQRAPCCTSFSKAKFSTPMSGSRPLLRREVPRVGRWRP
jgi:hypothetical protein